ncbi:hypothetical protein [Providencia rettgeri]|uniref:hypothetical protein n=1 Tax=Providencia rettgeri TaxID=587 RepID=UPI0014194BA2|nr:hypothetical protein [Providencia rettgeri]NIH07061.1 hypothetical protein [Providencia rettgeri]
MRYLLLTVVLLTGCSTTTFDSGTDYLYQLTERHVVYRDLTVPESMGNLAEPQKFTPVSAEQ